MARFTDASGREWELRLTVGALADVRERAKVDLGQALKSMPDLASLLFDDPGNFARVLWALVEDQAGRVVPRGPEGAPLTPEEFSRSLDGPALERAGTAFLEMVADFFPRSAVAAARKEGLAKMLERLDQALIATLTGAESRSAAGSSPASPTSTPAP